MPASSTVPSPRRAFHGKGRAPGRTPSPAVRQLFCRSCGCSFLAGLENNEFSIKPPSPSSVPGGNVAPAALRCDSGQEAEASTPKGKHRRNSGRQKAIKYPGVWPGPWGCHPMSYSTLTATRGSSCPRWCERRGWARQRLGALVLWELSLGSGTAGLCWAL